MARHRKPTPDFSRVHAMKVHPEEGPLTRLVSFLALYALFAGFCAGFAAILPMLVMILAGMIDPALWELVQGWGENDTAATMRRRALIGGVVGMAICAAIIFLAQRGWTLRRLDRKVSRQSARNPTGRRWASTSWRAWW
ncbi:MAG: hypothetical protein WD009_13645 [Phycisphaeraceae bacterium]